MTGSSSTTKMREPERGDTGGLFRVFLRVRRERAKGVLQRDLGMSEDEAYRTMQRESRQRRISMHDIAEAILLGDDLKKGRDAAK